MAAQGWTDGHGNRPEKISTRPSLSLSAEELAELEHSHRNNPSVFNPLGPPSGSARGVGGASDEDQDAEACEAHVSAPAHPLPVPMAKPHDGHVHEGGRLATRMGEADPQVAAMRRRIEEQTAQIARLSSELQAKLDGMPRASASVQRTNAPNAPPPVPPRVPPRPLRAHMKLPPLIADSRRGTPVRVVPVEQNGRVGHRAPPPLQRPNPAEPRHVVSTAGQRAAAMPRQSRRKVDFGRG